ncbi:TPA: hypothetical protein MCA25_003787 [Klebsiella pneumoniae]|uniref:hypothetical protein n=1 Tax=Klebsiella variicola TaxID=244366 RepID=UPI00330EB84F|nr:hypothetical protein [Klebsiella pneumoniae]HDE1031279.1 hypothetical protein [Klebsiella pneumoniae]
MKLPERLYYPLPEAATKLGCSVKDLYHFAAIGALDVTVFFPSLKNDCLMLMIPDFMEEDIDYDLGGVLGSKRWTISGITLQKDAEIPGYYAKSMSGFFYLTQEYLAVPEFLGADVKIRSPFFTTRPESEGWECQIMTINDGIEIDTRFLCVMADDLAKIKEIGSLPVNQAGESPKTVSKKAELIPALLQMIPELEGLDIETGPIAKITSVLEAAAAAKGVDLPATDKNTWAKYLGRK